MTGDQTGGLEPLRTTLQPPSSAVGTPPGAGYLERRLVANFTRDLLGNTLAVIVLASMILSVGGAIFFFGRAPGASTACAALTRWRGLLIPVLCLIGLGVAGYLAYVETAQVEAVCGPVGDCNTVQQSEYARLFGILPIGVLGMAGYVAIIAAWFTGQRSNGNLADNSSLAMLAMTAFGALFSIYLTFLEPFVIGATCAWCLTSAIIMTTLMLLSIAPGKLGVSKLMRRNH